MKDLQKVARDLAGDVTVAQAAIGYPRAPDQTWIVSVAGRARLTVVSHEGAGGSTAGPDSLCSG